VTDFTLEELEAMAAEHIAAGPAPSDLSLWIWCPACDDMARSVPWPCDMARLIAQAMDAVAATGSEKIEDRDREHIWRAGGGASIQVSVGDSKRTLDIVRSLKRRYAKAWGGKEGWESPHAEVQAG
jgi:hypothetical protein